MFKAFLDGVAAMVGWRVGEAVIRGAQREVGRAARTRNARAKAEFLEELAAAARELPGGTPQSAIVVVSSAQIEPHAAGMSCLVCEDGGLRVEQHRAETLEGIAVRTLDLSCGACDSPRTAYFRIDRSN
jgi:hypothetical protein